MSEKNLPAKGGHYSRWQRAAGLVFTAGLVPRDANRNIIGNTIEEQTKAVIDNLRLVLDSAGCELSDLVRVQVFLADMNDFARFNDVYALLMGDVAPARTTIGCALNGVLVEIDAIACPGREVA